MRWLWVRHGETDMNRQKRYLGHSDVPLNERGKGEAAELAKRWTGLIGGPVRLYASDLCRCVQTAQPLAQMWGTQVVTVPALRELSFGDWELFTYEQLMKTDEKRATRWYNDPFACSPPNGESLEQLGERVDSWLRGVLAELTDSTPGTGNRKTRQPQVEPPKTVVIVTHGGVIRWFQAAWLEQDPGRYWQVDGARHGEALLVDWDGQRWTAQSVTK